MESLLDRSTIRNVSLSVSIATAEEAIRWTADTFGDRCCLLTSLQDAVLIDLVVRNAPQIPIVFLDNGYHFAQTLDMVRTVEDRYGVTLEVVRAGLGSSDVDASTCCDLKVGLLEAALHRRDAWLTGIQRTATTTRANTSIVDFDKRGKVKVSPLAQWSDDDRARYIEVRNVPTHPLLAMGYTSIGCEPCTSPALSGGRSGRWAGTDQTECGLHL